MELDTDEMIKSLVCITDDMTGLTHIGMQINDEDNTTISLYKPRLVGEGYDGDLVMHYPMSFGNNEGVMKISKSNKYIIFQPNEKLVDVYIESFNKNKLDTMILQVDNIQ